MAAHRGRLPNFLERIVVFSESFPSGLPSLVKSLERMHPGHQRFWRSEFAPFASKIYTLTISDPAPKDSLRCPVQNSRPCVVSASDAVAPRTLSGSIGLPRLRLLLQPVPDLL